MRLRTLAALLVLASPAAAAGAPLVPDETPAFNDWLGGVQARVIGSARKAVGFPRSARFVMSMLIHPDGSVSDIREVSSNDPDPRFAALAEHVVELAGPFPPMPPSAHHGDGAEITVPLAFNYIPPPPPPKHRRVAKAAHASAKSGTVPPSVHAGGTAAGD